ncbi:MAG TPA: DUF4410 domain-containing protein [Verrucomicrobiae bacterium]|nr:DUF4410 domain-containing protein [Verrucomicrobiae bacterium]
MTARPIQPSIAFLAPALCLLAGCASVSIRDQQVSSHKPKAKPAMIYVAPFETRGAAFNVDREGQELASFKQATAEMLQSKLIERLPEIAPAERAPKKLPASGWLVKGRFIRVNQGSRALRATIGFGLGATKMETEVAIYDLAISKKEPFLKFLTTGGSNAEPGALGSAGTTLVAGVSALYSALGNAAHGISEDAWRTSREIRNHLVDYCRETGL